MAEEAPRITPEFLRELYERMGVSPTAEELSALTPLVQAAYEGGRQLEQLLMLEQEPATSFRLPQQG